MDKETIKFMIDAMHVYAAVLTSDNFFYTNAPSDFDLSANELEYQGKDYLKDVNTKTKDGVEYTIISFTDVTTIKQKLKFDQKTGAYTETEFKKKVDKLNADGTPFVFAIIDVDNFKHFNDDYGHDVGDEVLKAVVQIFMHSFKSEDLVGRYGGDEFLLAITNIDIEIAQKRIRDIMNLLAGGLKFNNVENRIPITVSCGIKNYDNSQSYGQNFTQIDQSLYEGKNNGKNQIIDCNKGKSL